MNLEEHLAKAHHNWTFLTQIESADNSVRFKDWSTVALAYSALHLIDALLHSHGHDHGETHGHRQLALTRLLRERRISEAFRDRYLLLLAQSRAVRYTASVITAEEYARLVVEAFRVIEADVARRLRLEPFAPLPFER